MLEYCVYVPAQSLELRLMTAETTSGRFMVKQNWAAHLNWRHNIVLLQNKENLLELTAPHKLNWVEFPFHLFICFIKYSAYLFILDYEFFFFINYIRLFSLNHQPIFQVWTRGLKSKTLGSVFWHWVTHVALFIEGNLLCWRLQREIFVLLDKVWWSAARRRRWMDEVLLTDY